MARSRPCVVKTFTIPGRATIERALRSLDAQLTLVDAASSGPRDVPRPPRWIPDIVAWDMGGALGPWVAQEYRGANLRTALASRVGLKSLDERYRSEAGVRNVPWPAILADAILADLVRAVDFVHSQGVIHRDLKPENILVEQVRPFAKVALCDFDLAKGHAQPALTQTGVGMGTPGYSAPEQMLGMSRATQASDVYSVGMLMVFLSTGREPNDVMVGTDLTNLALDAAAAEALGDRREWVEGALSFWPENRPSLKDLLTTLNLNPHQGTLWRAY